MSIGLGPGDWTTAVEQAVAAELRRRDSWTSWTRWALGLAAATGAVALALLAWQLRAVPAETVATAEAVSTRHVAPLLQTDADLFANQVALARHQVDLGERLERLEAEAAALTRSLGALADAPVDAGALPPAIRRLPASHAEQQARLTTLEQRVRRLERLAADAGVAAPGR